MRFLKLDQIHDEVNKLASWQQFLLEIENGDDSVGANVFHYWHLVVFNLKIVTPF